MNLRKLTELLINETIDRILIKWDESKENVSPLKSFEAEVDLAFDILKDKIVSHFKEQTR